jgi:hypothetical protein
MSKQKKEYNMPHVIQSNPAVDYISGSDVYATGDTIALPFETTRYGTMYFEFQVGTIAGKAAQDGHNVADAIARCKQQMIDFPYMGHKMAWAFGLGAMVTAEKRDKKYVRAVAWGDTIELDGVRYSVNGPAYHNVELKEV